MSVRRMDHADVVVEDLAAAVTFVVDVVDEVFDSSRPHGAELVGGVAEYEDTYRYGYVRGPGGVIIGPIEELA